MIEILHIPVLGQCFDKLSIFDLIYLMIFHVMEAQLSCMEYIFLITVISFSKSCKHYNDAIMSAMAPQITGTSVVCSTVSSGTDQRKHQSSASLVFVRGIHRWPVDSPHKGPVTWKLFPFDDTITWSPFCFHYHVLSAIPVHRSTHKIIDTDQEMGCGLSPPWWGLIQGDHILAPGHLQPPCQHWWGWEQSIKINSVNT